MINVLFVGDIFAVDTKYRGDLCPEKDKCKGQMFSAFLSYSLIHFFINPLEVMFAKDH